MPPLFSDFRSPFSAQRLFWWRSLGTVGGWVGGRWLRQGVPGGARTRRALGRVCGKRTQILQEIRSERTIADYLHDHMEASLFTVKFALLNHTQKKGRSKKL